MKRTNFRFYRDELRWYVELPEWPGSHDDLEMVEGADVLLNILSNDHYEVDVKFTEEPFEGCHTLTLLENGYYNNNAWHGPSTIWLCHVTEFVFGKYPKFIYYAQL
jgi:hypothetical protein